MNHNMSIFQRQVYIIGLFFFLSFFQCSPGENEQKSVQIIENYSSFETSLSWQPSLDLQTDLILIRFTEDTSQFFQTAQSWRNQGYNVGGIFSINPDKIFEPSEEKKVEDLLTAFLSKGFKTIVLEEPKFRLTGEYSSAFQKYWEKETGSKWFAPADSADIWYRAAKLKQKSFITYLLELITFVKKFAATGGDPVEVYINSESSIAAASHSEVVPGGRIVQISSVDGVMGKVALKNRTFVYQNKRQENRFPVYYFDFSWFFNSVDQTGKQLFLPGFLQNQPNQKWSRELVTAAFMQPAVKQFQIIPVLAEQSPVQKFQMGLFAFLSESLKDIPSDQIKWSFNPWPKTGIVFSDTYMFERGGKWTCELESFYQQAMPFLQRGVPVQVVPLERVADENYLDQFDVLFMSYEGYKPYSPELHNRLQRWVYNRGGVLFFYLGATGVFDETEEWWADSYDRPHENLFELLKTGLYPQSGMHKVGRGIVYTDWNSPKKLAKTPRGGEIFWNTYTDILMSYVQYDSTILAAKNRLYLRRGPYHLIYIPDESDSFSVSGNFIDLFSDYLPVVDEIIYKKGDVGMLLNIDYFPEDSSAILCSSSKISDVISDQNSLQFSSFWIKDTPNITYIRLANQPGEIFCQDSRGVNLSFRQDWIPDKNILKLETISTGSSIRYRVVK